MAKKPDTTSAEEQPKLRVPPQAPAAELEPELAEALNGRSAPDNCNFQSRRRRRRELFAALLPVAVSPAVPITEPDTTAAIRDTLALADLALVLEEQHEIEVGLPLPARARR